MDSLCDIHGYIYALVDPRTGEIRYIGSSLNPVQRLREHHRNARKWGRFCSPGRTRYAMEPWRRRLAFLTRARDRWLHDLLQAGLQARLLILDTWVGQNRAGLLEREAELIRAYTRHTRLFNTGCPAIVKGFTGPSDLVAVPMGQPLWVQQPDLPLTRCEHRWLRVRERITDVAYMREALQRTAEAWRDMLVAQREQNKHTRAWALHDKAILPPVAAAAAAQGHALAWESDQHYRCTNAPCRAWGNVAWPADERWARCSGTNRPCPFVHLNHYRGPRPGAVGG